jgi:PrcB C-terminal
VRWGLSFVLAVLTLVACGSAPRPVAYTDLTSSVGELEFTRITRQLFRSREELVEVLAQHNPGRTVRLPKIDFSRQEIYLVAAGPRSSTGYELRIVSVQDRGDHIVVVVHEDTPSLGDPVTARVTYPFRLISLPRTDEPVKLKWPGRP